MYFILSKPESLLKKGSLLSMCSPVECSVSLAKTQRASVGVFGATKKVAVARQHDQHFVSVFEDLKKNKRLIVMIKRERERIKEKR